MLVRGVVPLAFAALLAVSAVASAQSAAPSKPVATDSAKPDPVRDAFLALPVEDRKAAQDALVWLGLYNGVTDGAFGKRTGDAILAYQKGAGLKADGVLTPDALPALKAAGAKPRDAVGFEIYYDTPTAVQIGAPRKLLQNLVGTIGHSALASKDGAVRLDILSETPPAPNAPGQGLEGLYKDLSADTDKRKVGYKAMKAGAFFVVTSEEGAAKVYVRYALGPKGLYRGFEFRYPKARADQIDRIAVAISNAFDPAPPAVPAKPATPAASASPVAVATPAGPALIATAFVLAPGQALTALTPAECAKPLVAGVAATFGRVDEASGLARLDGDFGTGASPVAGADAPTADAVLLSRAPAGGDKSVVEASRGDWTRLGGAEASLIASAGSSARGAPVFAPSGAVIGVLAASKTPPRRFGSVNVLGPRRAIAGAPLEAFLAKGAEGGTALSAPELARRFSSRVLAVTCGA